MICCVRKIIDEFSLFFKIKKPEKQMVGKPMAYNSIHSALDDGRLISEILQKIQSSGKETRLWTTQSEQMQPSLLRTKIAEKRAQFMSSMHNTESTENNNNPEVEEEEEIKKNELIILWNEPDPNNNNDVIDNVCIEPNHVPRIVRQSRLVRRSSSVDSGIVVRTNSEKNKDRRRLASNVSAKCCVNSNGDNKKLITHRKSNSLPNLNEIDLNKFERINFCCCLLYTSPSPRDS